MDKTFAFMIYFYALELIMLFGIPALVAYDCWFLQKFDRATTIKWAGGILTAGFIFPFAGIAGLVYYIICSFRGFPDWSKKR